MMFSIVAHRWLADRPITHKELATYFEIFVTEATVSRHLDDMEESGMIVRQTDPDDRRRIFLLPTRRLETIATDIFSANRLMRDTVLCGLVARKLSPRPQAILCEPTLEDGAGARTNGRDIASVGCEIWPSFIG